MACFLTRSEMVSGEAGHFVFYEEKGDQTNMFYGMQEFGPAAHKRGGKKGKRKSHKK
jgi:hypothetical protein